MDLEMSSFMNDTTDKTTKAHTKYNAKSIKKAKILFPTPATSYCTETF